MEDTGFKTHTEKKLPDYGHSSNPFIELLRMLLIGNGEQRRKAEQEDTEREQQDIVGLPFQTSNQNGGEEMSGILYVPRDEAFKVSRFGYHPGSSDIQIYGAETMDGRSLTASGFDNWLNSERGSGRVFTFLTGEDTNLRSGSENGRKVSLPGANLSDSNAFTNLQNKVADRQRLTNYRYQGNPAFNASRSFLDNWRSLGGNK